MRPDELFEKLHKHLTPHQFVLWDRDVAPMLYSLEYDHAYLAGLETHRINGFSARVYLRRRTPPEILRTQYMFEEWCRTSWLSIGFCVPLDRWLIADTYGIDFGNLRKKFKRIVDGSAE